MSCTAQLQGLVDGCTGTRIQLLVDGILDLHSINVICCDNLNRYRAFVGARVELGIALEGRACEGSA